MNDTPIRAPRAFSWAIPSREDVLFALGVTLVAVGLWLWSPSLALISLGLLLVFLAFRT